MVENYIANRQNPLQKVTASELNLRLEAVDHAFTRSWIERQDNHPVQRLWSRKDGLATDELVTLGHAICGLQGIDSKWTAETVEKIKSSDRNTRLGAVFELLGLSFVRAPGQRVKPTPTGTPGFDGTLYFDDGACLELSLKNYGLSSFERDVHLKSEEVEGELIDCLERESRTGVGLRIYASRYPSPSDWDSLIANLRSSLSSLASTPNQLFAVGDAWKVQAHPIGVPGMNLSSKPTSFQTLIAVPFHANEGKNLLDKIDEARANFEKHAGVQSENTARALLLRLPENASGKLCADWAREYFRDNPSSALDAVILYQPTVSTNPEQKTNSIVHYVEYVGGPRFHSWQRPTNAVPRVIKFVFFVGLCATTPSQMMLTDGVKMLAVEGHYLHQKGEIFVAYALDAQGSMTANLSNPASGINFHAVLTIDNQSAVINGIFPPSLDLALYS